MEDEEVITSQEKTVPLKYRSTYIAYLISTGICLILAVAFLIMSAYNFWMPGSFILMLVFAALAIFQMYLSVATHKYLEHRVKKRKD
ncbi:hypothetical protein [Candidatus Methanomassiliicoccus intestinalis]|uniref:hypothetical protein n=1 Tax=Candidatus Methanomassiliicoccus intestinalis TaxID=1406512 RepID=UPI0037DC8F5F